MMETYRGHVRNPADAIKLFEACRRGLLPRVQRRLSEKERQSIQSGSVFVWDEREAGMRRWTDGKSWSASRVSGSFLTYREMEGKRGGGNFVPVPRRVGGKTPDSNRASDEDADMDGEGADGYRYKADGLMKQSFSITTSEGQHLHLISYFARSHTLMAELPQPSADPALRNVIPPKGMYPESTTSDGPPPVRSMTTHQAYMYAPQHNIGGIALGGFPPQGMARMPYPYSQGYTSWPPSPMTTPPYGYPPNGYASQLPPPMNGHPSSYHPQHQQHLQPHHQHHTTAPQAYDRPPPPPPISVHAGPHDAQTRFPGQLPQMSSNPYEPNAAPVSERHPSDPIIPRQTRHMSQPLMDTRLPPPLQHHYSAPQELGQTNGYQHPEGTSELTPLSQPLVDVRLPLPLQPPYYAPPELAQTNGYASQHSERLNETTTISPSHMQQAGANANATIAADLANHSGTVSPAQSVGHSITEAMSSVTTESTTTPEIAWATAVEAANSGSATPGEGAQPPATDIPHAKLAVGGPAGFAGEDLRAIRVLDRKFCI